MREIDHTVFVQKRASLLKRAFAHSLFSFTFGKELIDIYFSIKFADPDGKNEIDTFDDWRIVPESRPLVAPPEVKTEYLDIPGADGSLDYTEALAGIKYSNREGRWSFYVLNELANLPGVSYMKWNELYSLIMKTVHGKRKRIWLESDPDYYYTGRIFVDQWASNENYSKISLKYNIDPWKYPVTTTANRDWLWNELFGNVIYYGRFDIVSQKHRNLINPTDEAITPVFYTTSPMTVTFGSNTYTISETTTTAPFRLAPGDNFMVFEGNGRVTVDYSLGRAL